MKSKPAPKNKHVKHVRTPAGHAPHQPPRRNHSDASSIWTALFRKWFPGVFCPWTD